MPLLTAALLTVPATVIQESDLASPWQQVGTWLNWAIWITFLAEVAIMLAIAPRRRDWLRHHPLEVAIVLLTPPAFLAAIQPLRLLRLLRALRILRLGPLFKLLLSEQGLQYSTALAFLTAVVGGAAFASVENISVGNGIYWAVVTMTTVGYGDIAPKTTDGKIVAIVVMLIGIGTATVFIGAIAQRFVATSVEETVIEVEEAQSASEEDALTSIRDIQERNAEARGCAPNRPTPTVRPRQVVVTCARAQLPCSPSLIHLRDTVGDWGVNA